MAALLQRPFSSSLAARERAALCSLALTVGGSEPTLCSGWTVKDLVVHLLMRERKPWAAAAGLVPGLSALPARVRSAYAARDLRSLVTQLESVPAPLWLIDPVFNGMEMFVHHEDIRRAQPSWTARDLSTDDERTLWLGVRMLARVQGRRLDVPLVVEAGERRTVVVRGAEPVIVSGPVSEILLFMSGRSALRGVTYDGPAAGVEAVKTASLPL